MEKISLKLKIILFFSILIILILASSFLTIRYFVKKLYFNEVVGELKKAQKIFESHQKIKRDYLVSQGILIADLPKFKAAVETNDLPTIKNVAESYRYLIPNDFILITDKEGNILVRIGEAEEFAIPFNIFGFDPVENTLKIGREGASVWSFDEKIYEIVAVPFFTQYRVSGALVIGYLISEQTAAEIKTIINSEVIFSLDKKIIAASLAKLGSLKNLDFRLDSSQDEPAEIRIENENYLLSKNVLDIKNSDKNAYYLILHSIDHYYVFLRSLTLFFMIIGISYFFLTFFLSVAISGAITKPLRNLTRFIKDITVSEDLARKIDIETSDQDLKVMSDAFNHFIKALNQAKENEEEAYFNAIEAMVTALDTRDNETAGHSQRVALYTKEIAVAMGIRDSELIDIERGALLHDIGKIGIPDVILRKPGRLSEEEWEIIKKHPYIGYVMLRKIKFLRESSTIVYSHHERYDGAGYPRGLKGKEIPVGVRIFAVADAFDAMTTERPYRSEMAFDEAKKQIIRFSGLQFDPEVVEIFLKTPDQRWVEIGEKVENEYVPMIKEIKLK